MVEGPFCGIMLQGCGLVALDVCYFMKLSPLKMEVQEAPNREVVGCGAGADEPNNLCQISPPRSFSDQTGRSSMGE